MTNNPFTPLDWMDQNVNSISPTACGAKWYNATVWLGNGATTSCHHPPAHPIDPEEVKKNPSALHNTTYKKLVRKQMQEGIQTKECDYCWKIENLNQKLVSDRYYKSAIYTPEELREAFKSDWRQDIVPKQLEISFDNNCNFACSYCNSGFSTTWAHDIKKNGPYQDLVSDGNLAYASDGAWASPYGVKNEGNPYLEAFWKWWESDLSTKLSELRVTGGEATVSNQFWKLIDWYDANPDCNVTLSVNTNLGVKQTHLEKLCNASHSIKKFNLFTSNESFGANAEYIRDGLIWDDWSHNFEYVMTEGNFNIIHCMMTINTLCLASFEEFHEYIFELRGKYPGKKIEMSHNILRFPSFQSITVLPREMRDKKTSDMNTWLDKNKKFMAPHEIDGYTRTIQYIAEVDQGHDIGNRHSSLEKRQSDFYNFYRQYDRRRNKSFADSFSNWPELIEWYGSLAESAVKDVRIDKFEGSVFGWGKPIYDEVMGQAKKDGLIDD